MVPYLSDIEVKTESKMFLRERNFFSLEYSELEETKEIN
jgi:hypothetical protein